MLVTTALNGHCCPHRNISFVTLQTKGDWSADRQRDRVAAAGRCWSGRSRVQGDGKWLAYTENRFCVRADSIANYV